MSPETLSLSWCLGGGQGGDSGRANTLLSSPATRSKYVRWMVHAPGETPSVDKYLLVHTRPVRGWETGETSYHQS